MDEKKPYSRKIEVTMEDEKKPIDPDNLREGCRLVME
jgi:hypothetical protein